MTRGVPGTHDIDLMLHFFKKIQAKNFREFTLPKFNKAFDDRYKKNLRIMSQRDLLNFMQTYQRITQQMFKDVPKYASIIMSLNNNHQIQKIKFNK